MKSVLVILVSIFGSLAHAKTLPMCFSKDEAVKVMIRTYSSYELADFKKVYGAEPDFAELLERFQGTLQEAEENIKNSIQPILNSGAIVGYETVLSVGGEAPRGMSCRDGSIKIDCQQDSVTLKLPMCWGN